MQGESGAQHSREVLYDFLLRGWVFFAQPPGKGDEADAEVTSSTSTDTDQPCMYWRYGGIPVREADGPKPITFWAGRRLGSQITWHNAVVKQGNKLPHTKQ